MKGFILFVAASRQNAAILQSVETLGLRRECGVLPKRRYAIVRDSQKAFAPWPNVRKADWFHKES
jgi:hypothetical protein